MSATPVAIAFSLLLPIAGVGPAADGHGGFAECEAFAPEEQECTVRIVPDDGVSLSIPIDLAYSGTLVIKGEQFGTVVWNGTCIIPAGFLDTGVGGCVGEDGERFVAGAPLNLTVRVGVYGVGTFGLRATY